MKCSNCDGWGLVQIAPNVKGLKRCPVCNGTGEVGQIEQTNEEWIKSMNTEQLARIIYELMWHKEKYPELCVYPVVDSVVEWLKQPHTEKG